MNSSSYCPACGDSKKAVDDYCPECTKVADIIIIVDAAGWESEPMYPYDYLPEYIVGYVSDVTTFTP